VRGFMRGEVYFIDPVDGSGPYKVQQVYVMTLQDFFYRIRDSYGATPMRPSSREFAWVGHPSYFLP